MDAHVSIIITILVILLLLLIESLCEPFLIRRSHLRYPDFLFRFKSGRDRNLNAGRFQRRQQSRPGDAIRVVFFSDLHIETFFTPKSRLIRLILSAEPDLIIFGGDLLSDERGKDKALQFLRRLCKIAAEHSIPLMVVPGNHDVSISAEEWTACGAHLLDNRGLSVQREGGRIWQILGLEDLRRGQPDHERAETTPPRSSPQAMAQLYPASRLRFAAAPADLGASEKEPCLSAKAFDAARPRAYCRLLVAHNPDTLLNIPKRYAQLFLAGHFHGGQIRLPFRLEFKTLRNDQLCREGYYKSLFLLHGNVGYISSGVGNVLLPMRFMCRPEIVVVDLADHA